MEKIIDKLENKNQSEPPKTCLTNIIWGLWVGAIIFFGQNTLASMYENEKRAAIIYALFTILLMMGGGIVSMSRKYKNFL